MSFIKTKNCFSKDNIKKMKRQISDWKKIFAIHMSDKGFVSGIYKFLQFNKEKTNRSRKKWTKDSNRHIIEDLYE